MSEIRPLDCSKLVKNPKNDNNVTIFQFGVNVNFFFDVVLFLLSSLVTGARFMSISSLVLELWQFPFIRDWPEIRKSEISPSEFCPISVDWDELSLPNLAQMFLIECYWVLQNSKVTTFSVFESLRENHLGGGGKITPLLTQIRVNIFDLKNYSDSFTEVLRGPSAASVTRLFSFVSSKCAWPIEG